MCVHVCGSYEKFTENVEYDNNSKKKKSLTLCNEFTSPVTLERKQRQVKSLPGVTDLLWDRLSC